MPRASILLAEDDPSVLQAIGDTLQDAGYQVLRAASGRQAQLMLSESVDVLITDLWMPGIDGLALLSHAKQAWPLIEVILITGNATVPSAVQAMKSGAFDYLTKPFAPPDLLEVLERALEERRMRLQIAQWRTAESGGGAASPLQDLIGASPAMGAVCEAVRRVAPFKSTVLVSGESGTGKELVVRAIHELSPRKDGPFVAVNCAAVPATLLESELFGHERGAFTGASSRAAGYFEAAHRGTLFIDEVAELELNLQAKLLRALETDTITAVGSPRERPVDVRVIAATNTDLARAVEEKRFRPDVFYRLSVVRIDLPPLRERVEDIPLLARNLLGRLCAEHRLPVPEMEPEALALLQRYPWPGNVRELRNALESILILSGKATIAAHDLPEPIRRAASAGSHLIDLDAAEKATLEKALRQTGGDRSAAAQLLNISVRTLYRKMARYGLR